MLRGAGPFLNLELEYLQECGARPEERSGPGPGPDLLEAEPLVGGHRVVEVLDDLDEASGQGRRELGLLLHTICILATFLA
jgi:hypothetical protein